MSTRDLIQTGQVELSESTIRRLFDICEELDDRLRDAEAELATLRKSIKVAEKHDRHEAAAEKYRNV